ncbi:MAG: hypothetical protein Q4D32_09575 [Eubacteriales bacterium]|nr:hypothetical protein [Eubacteriales bacterium]
MEHLPVSETSRQGERKSGRWFLAEYNDRRMESGNISLIAAAILPLIHFALLSKISIVVFAGFVVYELLLVTGVAQGTKQYHKMYDLQGRSYPYGPHTPARWIFGFSIAFMAVAPSRGFPVLFIWCVGMLLSFVVNFIRGERKNLWKEFLVEYATAVRAGYLFYLLGLLLFFGVIGLIF